jgi:hypothetical protein
MSEPLSQQIGAFRRQFGRYVDAGGALAGDAVEALDGVFASFQAQARMLEGGGAPDLAVFDEICRAASAEAKAIAGMAERLEATTKRLRSAETVAFPLRGEA